MRRLVVAEGCRDGRGGKLAIGARKKNGGALRAGKWVHDTYIIEVLGTLPTYLTLGMYLGTQGEVR